MLSEEIYNYLYGDWLSRTFYFFVIGVVLTLGPVLGTTMVLFERFGADSQKRTIINRLCSFIFINASIKSFSWGVLRILRDSLGLLNLKLFYPRVLSFLLDQSITMILDVSFVFTQLHTMLLTYYVCKSNLAI